VATAHATMGCIAELLALYIILSAGTRILPEALRFVRYKLWMRTALVVWWLALLLGLTTYVRWYVAPKQIPPRSPSSSRVPSAPVLGKRLNCHEKHDSEGAAEPFGLMRPRTSLTSSSGTGGV
jgi:hypothetical protein